MEILGPRSNGSRRWLIGLMFVAGVLLAAGCVSTSSFLTSTDAPPKGPVCQIAATWNNEVVFTADPTHGGQPTPGIAGRVYLFGPNLWPTAGDGTIVVDLYDESKATENDSGVLVEEWRFDKVTLQQLLRRDPIGWGYTLFLPWGTYKEDLPSLPVHFRVRYEATSGGAPLFTEGATMTLNNPKSKAVAVASRTAKGTSLVRADGTAAKTDETTAAGVIPVSVDRTPAKLGASQTSPCLVPGEQSSQSGSGPLAIPR
jgi:hypothetical protein